MTARTIADDQGLTDDRAGAEAGFEAGTAPGADDRASVLDRWRSAADRYGDRVALRDSVLRRDHAEVWALAAGRAAHLRSRGLRAEGRVAVILRSGVEQATWLAAVTLAGGCAVPIGLNQPDERIRALIALARPALVGTDPDTGPLAAGHERVPADHPGSPDPLPPSDPGPAPDQAAYICFTSGTTGRPKGVVVTHRALARTSGEIAERLDLGRRPRTHVLATSWSFDVATMDLWLALTTGGTLFVPGRDALLGPALPRTLATAPAPVLHTVPSLFAAASAEDLRRLPADTTIMTGGEPVPAAVLRQLAADYDLRVVYGITETAIISTIGRAEAGTPPEYIGQPLAGADCEVVDETGAPVPDGQQGELLIGGPVVARGYLDDPAGTARRFEPAEGGTRRYRTGDLVRRHPDGHLTFHGRVDHQVKIRGHRVEPAEVEALLLNVPGVRQAAVLTGADPGGGTALIAYLATDGSDASAVRRALGTTAPDWMVPRLIHVLPSLPLSTTGKIDRRALPEPDWDGEAPTADQGTEELTPTEQAVGELWRQTLGVGALPPDASFVDLGGHSLKAAQLSTALQDTLGVAVAIPDVLSAPNLRELSRQIDLLRDSSPASSAGSDPEPARSTVPTATRLLWLHQALAGDTGIYNLVMTVRLRGPLQPAALQRALQLTERVHPALRTTYEFDDDDLVAVEHPPSNRPLAIRGGAVDDAIREAGRVALGTAGRPVWTYELFTQGPDEAVLLLAFHHVAVDGIAFHVLLRGIAEAYSAAVGGGQRPVLPSRPDTSAPGAAPASQDTTFWEQMFHDAPEPSALPGQREADDITDFAGWCVPVEIPGVSASSLARLAAKHGATLQAVVLSAFVRAVAHASGQPDPDTTVGVAFSRRGIDAGPEAVGQFVTVVPVRFRLPADTGAVACLQETVRTMHAAQRHSVTDPAAVVSAARAGQRRWTEQPFRIAFSWEDEFPAPDFAGLEPDWAVEFNGWADSELDFGLVRRGDAIAGRVIGRRATSADVSAEDFLRDLTRCLHELVTDLEQGTPA